jgi:hypothetical protein
MLCGVALIKTPGDFAVMPWCHRDHIPWCNTAQGGSKMEGIGKAKSKIVEQQFEIDKADFVKGPWRSPNLALLIPDDQIPAFLVRINAFDTEGFYNSGLFSAAVMRATNSCVSWTR